MKIGCLKEVKDNENRVALVPKGAGELVKDGCEIYIQTGAGLGSGFANGMYSAAGAILEPSAEKICETVDILMKVKEPIPSEYPLLDKLKGKVLFTYLHLAAADKKLTEKLMENDITAVAYETVEAGGRLPLLEPMSNVAGGLAAQFAAQYLQIKYGGKGKSMTSITGVEPVKVVVVGGGIVGATAAEKCAGMGANVAVFDKKEEVLDRLRSYMPKNVAMINSDTGTLGDTVAKADVVIGAVLIPGAKAKRIVTEEMVKSMEKGSVLVDVSIDQGGCIWGAKATTHSSPTYELDGKIYCCITNMPGQVAHDSTIALTNATMPYLASMAEKGVEDLAKEDDGFAKGINTIGGKLTCKPVADALEIGYTDVKDML